MIPTNLSDPLLDVCMYASYRAQRELYGIPAERLVSWYADAEVFERMYRQEKTHAPE
jgi:hypothetical protein